MAATFVNPLVSFQESKHQESEPSQILKHCSDDVFSGFLHDIITGIEPSEGQSHA